jgi:L-2-hydroxyglutarate oxidase LhgO
VGESVECVVIGAGAVGLAVARALAMQGIEVLVIEKEAGIGFETSSRNSEVIHAGLYYPSGSLKARFCVAGKQALYSYCEDRGVPHDRIGKLVVATTEQELRSLENVMKRAAANGVHDLVRMSADEVRAIEPALDCVAAFHSPSTGIIDSHALMLAYQGDAEANGAMVVFRSTIAGGRVTDTGFELDVAGDEPMSLECRMLVNSAGLFAPAVSRRIQGIPRQSIPTDYLCKGSYYTLTGRAPFRHLVYPVPESAGLGVHLTLDLAGQARFGPDVEWIEAIDYTVDLRRADGFYAAIRKYWPGLPDGSLQPGYSGIRPKISGKNEPAADFMVQGPEGHGVPGLYCLYGIESPGITASPAIAEHVRAMVAGEASGTGAGPVAAPLPDEPPT